MNRFIRCFYIRTGHASKSAVDTYAPYKAARFVYVEDIGVRATRPVSKNVFGPSAVGVAWC